jgi:hypothetical protein
MVLDVGGTPVLNLQTPPAKSMLQVARRQKKLVPEPCSLLPKFRIVDASAMLVSKQNTAQINQNFTIVFQLSESV